MSSLKNTSYFFIPFVYNKHADFNSLIKALDESALWEQVHDEIVYMLKYVADKIDSYNKDTCQCFHYVLKETGRTQFGLASENEWFSTIPHSFRDEEAPIRFQLLNIQLYCFSTTVGIIAFKVHLEQDDPFWVSNAQYHLKKVSREKVFSDTKAPGTTMLEIARKLVSELSKISEIKFFYYANPSTESSIKSIALLLQSARLQKASVWLIQQPIVICRN